MQNGSAEPRWRRAPVRWLPGIILLVMSAGAILVWNQQVQHQRSLIRRHTDAVGAQAARRLEVFLTSRLTVARIFARRWATHESRDFSRQRFEPFARLLILSIPGFHSIRLVPASGERGWTVPRSRRSALHPEDPALRRLLERVRTREEALLSAPVAARDGTRLFAAFSLHREHEFLGWLVVDLDVPTLMEDCFHHRIRTEFQFDLHDHNACVYHFPQSQAHHWTGPIQTTWQVQAGGRKWVLRLAPRHTADFAYTAPGNLAVLGLGLLFSFGTALLSWLLLRRMLLHRQAQHRALQAAEQRSRAQAELEAAQVRFRNVFEAATNGLLVLDEEGRIREANQAAGEMLGIVHSGLRGMALDTVLPTVQRQLLAQAKGNGVKARPRLEARAPGSGDAPVDLDIQGSAFREAGALRRVLVLTDVTHRRAVERRLTQLSRSVLLAQEEERERVSRDLHDELGQIITAIRFELGLLERGARDGPVELRDGLRELTEHVEHAASELRRVCQGLRPPLLDDLGLEPAVRQLVQRFGAQSRIQMELDLRLEDPPPKLSPEAALCAYRVLQECLTNVARHAGASTVWVSMAREDGDLVLSVYDNGRGFDPEHGRGDGSGITGMAERANLVSGTVEIRSVDGEGTRVTLRLPLTQEAPPPRPTHLKEAADDPCLHC